MNHGLWNPVDVDLVDFAIVARVQTLRHAEDDSLAAIGEDQHLTRLAIEIDALDFTRSAELGERLFVCHVRI